MVENRQLRNGRDHSFMETWSVIGETLNMEEYISYIKVLRGNLIIIISNNII